MTDWLKRQLNKAEAEVKKWPSWATPNCEGNMEKSECNHKYVFAGMRYKIGSQRPGSGAHDIEYFEHYFCEKCLDNRYVNKGAHGTSYENIRFDATPL